MASRRQIWAELHEQAIAGWAPRRECWCYLAEGMLRPDIYDPTLNPLYRDVLAHYGAVALPRRRAYIDPKVVAIDGKRLTEYMIDFEVEVTTGRTAPCLTHRLGLP